MVVAKQLFDLDSRICKRREKQLPSLNEQRLDINRFFCCCCSLLVASFTICKCASICGSRLFVFLQLKLSRGGFILDDVSSYTRPSYLRNWICIESGWKWRKVSRVTTSYSADSVLVHIFTIYFLSSIILNRDITWSFLKQTLLFSFQHIFPTVFPKFFFAAHIKTIASVILQDNSSHTNTLAKFFFFGLYKL